MISLNLHERHQSAYKASHSTETALLRVYNDILESIDKKKCVMLVLLDLSAAFDTVDHTVMLKRLEESFGISGCALEWMGSYLTNRTQSVCVNGCSSDPRSLHYGMPQGSVVGPFRFTCYSTPLGAICRQHDLNYHLYADDTQMYLSFSPSDQLSPRCTSTSPQ